LPGGGTKGTDGTDNEDHARKITFSREPSLEFSLQEKTGFLSKRKQQKLERGGGTRTRLTGQQTDAVMVIVNICERKRYRCQCGTV